MNCPICKNSGAHEKVIKHSPDLKGEKLEVYSKTFYCPKCGFNWKNDDQMAELRQKTADEYKKKHDLLTSTQLKEIRKLKDMTQKEFASFLSVGEASIKRWETYKIQEVSIDQLIKLKCDANYALLNTLEMAITRPEDEFTGKTKFNWKKLKALILYFIPISKSPLFQNKILFYLDFFHFKKCGIGITGSAYAKLDFGPCPDQQKAIYTKLKLDKTLIEGKGHNLIVNEKPDFSIFNDDEKETIELMKKYLEKNGVEKVYELSHEEKAYSESGWYSEIKYGYANELKIKL